MSSVSIRLETNSPCSINETKMRRKIECTRLNGGKMLAWFSGLGLLAKIGVIAGSSVVVVTAVAVPTTVITASVISAAQPVSSGQAGGTTGPSENSAPGASQTENSQTPGSSQTPSASASASAGSTSPGGNGNTSSQGTSGTTDSSGTSPNSQQAAPAAPAITVPGAPTVDPRAGAAGDGTDATGYYYETIVGFVLTPPASDGGSSITTYGAACSYDNGATWSSIGLSSLGALPGLECLKYGPANNASDWIGNLPPALFRIRAINAVGAGPWTTFR